MKIVTPYSSCSSFIRLYGQFIGVVLVVLLINTSTVLASDVPSQVDWSKVTIIDVRSLAEWNDSRLEGAIWIPWNQIEQGIKHYQIPADAPLAFYCEAGVRADRAIRRLKRLGFNTTYNLINEKTAARITGRLIRIGD